MKKFWIYTCMLFAVLVTACDDVDNLEDDIKALEDRVTALEEKVKPLNDNVLALVEIYKQGVISKIEENNGHYTLTLSNGKTIELAKWVEGFGSMPMVAVSAEGNWQVSYDHGQTWKDILREGKPVPAVGNAGKAPQFRVSADGYWEVDADGSGNFVQVKDVNGKPVKAVYDPSNPSQQFTEVTVKDDMLEITMGNGNKVNVPIAYGFSCYFKDVTSEVTFNPNETKKFNVFVKGVDHTLVQAPMGWKAELGAADDKNIAILTVTAPNGKLQPAVRATADNTRDIAIVAFKGNFASITKIQVTPIEVEMGGTPQTPETPQTPDQPATGDLIVALPTAAIENIGTYTSANHVVNEGWFQRENADAPVSELSVSAEGISVKIAGADKGTWNKSSFGFHTAQTFTKGVYKLTFQVKANVESSVGIGIRAAGDDKGFRMLKNDETNWERDVTTPKVAGPAWEEVSQLFDFGYASEAMTSTAAKYTEKETATSAADLTGISLYFYNNKAGTTITIKDVKLVKVK